MTKRYQVCGIANPLMDILASVSEQELKSLGIEKNSYDLVDSKRQGGWLEALGDRDLKLCSGGSVANSVIAIAQLGGRAALIGSLGDDRYGHFYKGECEQLGLRLGANFSKNETTGICLSLVTPDAERTMRTSLAAALQLSPEHVDATIVADSEWLYVEGYTFANGAGGQDASKRAIEIAKKNGTKVALTVSDSFVIDLFGAPLKECLAKSDLVFANTAEAIKLTGASDVFKAYTALKSMVKNVVITRSEDGALIHYLGKDYSIDAFPCKPIDVTGAGDMFSGALLYGLTNGFDPAEAGKGAAYLANQVISKVGARLHGDVKSLWEEVV